MKTAGVRKDHKIAAVRAMAYGLNVFQRSQKMFTVFIRDFSGRSAHAAEEFNIGENIVAVEPEREIIRSPAEKNRTAALLEKYPRKIISPESDAAPADKSNKRKARSTQPGVCFGATCAINPGIHPANQRENQHYPEVILKRYEPLYANTIGWGRGVCQ